MLPQASTGVTPSLPCMVHPSVLQRVRIYPTGEFGSVFALERPYCGKSQWHTWPSTSPLLNAMPYPAESLTRLQNARYLSLDDWFVMVESLGLPPGGMTW